MSNMYDGLGSTLAFGSFVINKTKIVAPPIEGGDPIDITTLENTAWRTKVLKQLKDLGECSFTGIWDPAKHISAPVNENGPVVFTGPDGDSITFQGGLTTFESGDIVEGEYPECSGTLVATNFNGTAETAPTYAAS